MEDMVERQRRGETRSWYRVPSQGVTAGSKRIAEAVDNEEWQKFRYSLKGKSTAEKLDMLEEYFGSAMDDSRLSDKEIDDVWVRVNNYLGALCRGGQLVAGVTCKVVQELNGAVSWRDAKLNGQSIIRK